jgi:hypothetical protein
MDQRPLLPHPPQEPAPPGLLHRGPWRTGASVVFMAALVAMLGFWGLLLLSDDSVSPFAPLDPPAAVFVVAAVLHLVSAPAAWLVAIAVAKDASHLFWVVFGVALVPVAAVTSLVVLMTDAVLWRDDLTDWLFAVMLALVGPLALAVQLSASLWISRSATQR